MKKTTTIKCISAMIFVSSILAVGNIVAFSNGGVIDLFLSKSTIDYDSDAAKEALTLGKNLAQEICQNGNVLLKNSESSLPLNTNDGRSVNIFGWGGSENGFLYQGGGSSEGGYSGDKISLYSAFRLNGFDINEDLATKYNALSYRREGAPDQNQHSTYYRTYEPGRDFYKEDLMNDAVNFSDTAIMVFSRRATEGDDLPKVSYNESGEADTSRNYLSLTEKEEIMVEEVTSRFDKVICLINSPAPMEMGFLDNPKIDAAMYIGYPGYYGTMAIPEILTGDVNPSGRMSDTSAYKLDSAPSYVNSGSDATMMYSSYGSRYKDYAEGIYIGYKWYETAAAEGYFDQKVYTDYELNKTGYDAVVQYPLGYGLSYTNFDWILQSVKDSTGKAVNEFSLLNKDETLTFEVWVENKGTVAGKETVQLYYHAPYTKNEIEKAEVNLIDFQKTSSLEPGKGQKLELKCKVSDMASYDAYDSNNNGFMGYELDGGDYSFSLRTDSHNVKTDSQSLKEMTYNYKINENGYTIGFDTTTGQEVKNRFTTFTNETTGASSTIYEPQSKYGLSIDGNDASNEYNQGITYLSRGNFAGTYPTRTEIRSMSSAMYENVFKVHEAFNKDEDVMPTTSSKETSLTLNDVKGLDYDDPKWQQLIEQLSIIDLQSLSANGGFGTIALPSINKGKCIDSDGGTGFTSGVATGDGGHATKYPSANILACTWDWKQAYKWGHAIGEEGKALGINGWYAPGCNVHRSPLGGRNFEYFSEDGFMAGAMIAQTIKACTENGVYAYMKHFAGNDTDEGRNGQFIWMTEQSLREIWAKPGEVATKVGKANAMMVSVDRIGATRATGSYALLTSLLRDEWGFKGSTITDYYQGGNTNDLDEGIRAGNDIALLPNGTPSVFEDAKNPSATTVIALQKAAHNILYTYIDTIDRTESYTGVDLSDEIGSRKEDTSGQWWRPTLISIDAVLGATFIGLGVLFVYQSWFKKKKEEKQ